MLPVALPQQTLSLFPATYQQAREMLLNGASDCASVNTSAGFAPVSISPGSHPQLSTELIWMGPGSAEKLVVVISGTHGVEGHVGAAVQADLLQRQQVLPANTAILMVFALNPFGFAHSRRCDEIGIDLNRNFIDFTRPLPANDGYKGLCNAIYSDDTKLRQQAFEQFRQRQGEAAFEMAISGGQYSDPAGPFFGGHQPSHGRCVVEKLIQRYQLAGRQLAVVDIHSGLGPYAHGEIICDHPLGSVGLHVAKSWYGASVTSPELGDSSSVPKQGLLDYCWHPLMEKAGCFVTLEFGSYPIQHLFDVILEDHRSWKSGDRQRIADSALAMRKHFFPQDTYWRELVLIKSRQVVQLALRGLSND